MDNNMIEKVKLWTSYYRFLPHRFAEDYLGIILKPFQQIIIFFMMHFNYTMYIASRGQGKTWLTAVFSVIRCILFPKTKVVIASGIKQQALEVINKIDDMRKTSPNLNREIVYLSDDINSARVDFANGSWIQIVASTDSARGKRANLLIVDEFRLVDLDVINTVLRKFNADSRQPRYLLKDEYKNEPLERNKEIYLSSAWYKSHWSWGRFKAYLDSMINGSQYFVCGLPYQFSVAEGLYNKEQAIDEMNEADFDPVAWSMEMNALFYGESDKAFFNFADIEKVRNIQTPVYTRETYNSISLKNISRKSMPAGIITLLSADIAVSSRDGSDNTVFSIMQLIPSGSKGYERRVVYIEVKNGENTMVQANRIRQLYDDFNCDYVVLDTHVIGTAIYDILARDGFDQEREVEYGAWSCINDENLANRCVVADAPEVIYSVQGTARFNHDIAYALRDSIKRKKIRFLIDGNEARQNLLSISGFSQLSIEEQVELELPYKQTTTLVNEMINLESSISPSGVLTLKEVGSMRKDRYSSIAYANYIANELEREYLNQQSGNDDNWKDFNIW